MVHVDGSFLKNAILMMLGAKGILPPTDATYCFIATQFSQYYKHSESANLLRKLLLLHVWAGPKVKSLFARAQSLLTF
jgi:hypothetical protein